MNLAESQLQPLLGIRVLQVGDFEPVGYCGMLFVQGGAEVVRMASEPASSDSSSPEWAAVRSAYLNGSKTNLETVEEDIPKLIARAAEFDVIVAGAEFPWSDLPSDDSAPISVEITGYGRGGPNDGWIGNELVFAARGGAAEYTVDEAGTPVYGYGRRFHYLAGNYGFTAALALCYQGRHSVSSHPRIEVSVLETVVSMLGYPTTQYSYNGTSGVSGQAGPRFTLRCIDGYIVLGANGSWPPIAAMIGREELAGDPRFLTQGARYKHVPELGAIIEEWAGRVSIAEAVRQAEALSVPLVALASGEDLMTDQHLIDRDAWEEVVVPGVGTGKAPRAPYLLDGQRVGRVRS